MQPPGSIACYRPRVWFPSIIIRMLQIRRDTDGILATDFAQHV